jgi:hypothetical protein
VASNVDALVFIDANQYLNLYRITKGKKLLKPLMEQQQHIFLTEQVVQEVQRNKLKAAADFLNNQFEELKVRAFEVPDHLFDAVGKTSSELRGKLDDIRKKIDEVNSDLTQIAVQTLDLISRSEDEVSKTLVGLFNNAVPPTPEELQRSREREGKEGIHRARRQTRWEINSPGSSCLATARASQKSGSSAEIPTTVRGILGRCF